MLYNIAPRDSSEPMRPAPAHAPAWEPCWGISIKISAAIAAMARPYQLVDKFTQRLVYC